MCSNNDRWTRRFARKSLQLALAGALFVACAAADSRKPVVNPDPEYPEIARRMNLNGTVRVELVIAADGTRQPTAAHDPRQIQLGLKVSW